LAMEITFTVIDVKLTPDNEHFIVMRPAMGRGFIQVNIPASEGVQVDDEFVLRGKPKPVVETEDKVPEFLKPTKRQIRAWFDPPDEGGEA
jgi:hypothetical protein